MPNRPRNAKNRHKKGHHFAQAIEDPDCVQPCCRSMPAAQLRESTSLHPIPAITARIEEAPVELEIRKNSETGENRKAKEAPRLPRSADLQTDRTVPYCPPSPSSSYDSQFNLRINIERIRHTKNRHGIQIQSI